METKCTNGNTVETWYDRKARYYVTQTKDADGNYVGDADGAGTKEWSRINHADAVKTNGGEKNRRVLKLSCKMRVIDLVSGECQVTDET